MTRRSHSLPVLAALALLVAVAGCGGGGGSHTTAAAGSSAGDEGGREPSTGASQAEFVKAADAVCAKEGATIKRELESIVEENGGLNSLSKEKVVGEIVDEAIAPKLEAENRAIEALDRPAGAAEASEALLGAIGRMIAEAKADPRSFVLGGKAIASSERIAKSHGFAKCGGL